MPDAPASSEAPFLQRFADAEACWFASTRADGRAHLAPIWHVLVDNAAWVATMHTSVRARNVRVNPSVSLSHPDPMQAVILEGTATAVDTAPPEVAAAFVAKYDWNIGTDEEYRSFLRIEPVKLMAWGGDGAGGGRWRFDGGAWTVLS